MSTIINNGYKLNKKMTIEELHELTMKLRIKMQEVTLSVLEKRMAEVITDLVDTCMVRGEKAVSQKYEDSRLFSLDRDVFGQSYWYIQGKHNNAQIKKEVDPTFDLGCSIVFLPIQRKILAMLFSQQTEYRQALNEFNSIMEYRYFNNVDRPNEFSKKQWENRKRDWDMALPGLGFPALNGFSAELVINLPNPQEIESQRLLTYIPPLEERVKVQAEESLFERKWLELKSEDEGLNIGNLYVDVSRWLRTEEGRMELEKEKEAVHLVIKKDFTMDDLRRDLRNFRVDVQTI